MTVPRFKCVDRNIVSVIQRETFINTIEAVYPVNGVTLNVGGPTGEWAFHSLNVDVIRWINNIGTGAESWGKDIFAYGERMPIKTKSIAKIFSCHSLEHMMDAEGTLYEWHRVLKPGGLICIIVPAFEFHTHDVNITEIGERAPAEHTTKEFKESFPCQETICTKTREKYKSLGMLNKKHSESTKQKNRDTSHAILWGLLFGLFAVIVYACLEPLAICPHCGTGIKVNSRICYKCGKRV